MRSSMDCCMCCNWSCRFCTMVWSCTISLLAADALGTVASTSAATNTNDTNRFFIAITCLDAEKLEAVASSQESVVSVALLTPDSCLLTPDYWLPAPSTKCPRRFCCQHCSFDSVQNGFSLPKLMTFN